MSQHISSFVRPAGLTALLAPALLVACAPSAATPSTGAAASVPSTRTTAPATMLTFHSPLYGYTIDYPADWTVKPAVRAWSPDVDDVGTRDVLKSPGTPEIDIAMTSVAAGWTNQQWYDAHVPKAAEAAMPACFPPPSTWTPFNVGGRMGGLYGGIAGCSFTTVVSLADGRAVLVDALTDPSTINQGVFDTVLLHRVLDTFR